MPTILHLGVIDVPYTNYVKRGKRITKVASGTQTTGDVAEWLENKYHIMRVFYELHKREIDQAIADDVSGQLATFLATGRVQTKINLGSAMGKIQDAFSKFIDTREMEGIGYPGVPTKAALMGIQHRMGKVTTGHRRPPFRDTGLYEQSMKAGTTKEG